MVVEQAMVFDYSGLLTGSRSSWGDDMLVASNAHHFSYLGRFMAVARIDGLLCVWRRAVWICFAFGSLQGPYIDRVVFSSWP